jgi:hypothetical protein
LINYETSSFLVKKFTKEFIAAFIVNRDIDSRTQATYSIAIPHCGFSQKLKVAEIEFIVPIRLVIIPHEMILLEDYT